MAGILQRLGKYFEKFLDVIQLIVSQATALLVLGVGVVMLYMVLARYFFDYNLAWGNVILTSMMVWGVFIAVGSAARKRMHISIGFFSELIFKKRAALVRSVSECFLGLPFCIYLAWHSWSWVDDNRATGVIKFVGTDTYEEWIPEVIIPIGFVIAALFYLERCVKLLYQLYMHLSRRKQVSLSENEN